MVSHAYVVFSLAGQSCALRGAEVREILHIPELGRPPTTPPILEGFLDFGGDAIPLLRLDRLLGLTPSPASAYQHILLLRLAAPLALLVDRVTDVVRIADERRAPVGARESFNGCVDAEILGDGVPVHCLSLDRLLTVQEQERLAAHHALEQARLSAFAGAA